MDLEVNANAIKKKQKNWLLIQLALLAPLLILSVFWNIISVLIFAISLSFKNKMTYFLLPIPIALLSEAVLTFFQTTRDFGDGLALQMAITFFQAVVIYITDNRKEKLDALG